MGMNALLPLTPTTDFILQCSFFSYPTINSSLIFNHLEFNNFFCILSPVLILYDLVLDHYLNYCLKKNGNS